MLAYAFACFFYELIQISFSSQLMGYPDLVLILKKKMTKKVMNVNQNKRLTLHFLSFIHKNNSTIHPDLESCLFAWSAVRQFLSYSGLLLERRRVLVSCTGNAWVNIGMRPWITYKKIIYIFISILQCPGVNKRNSKECGHFYQLINLAFPATKQ